MRLALVNHHGKTAAGAEHALLLFVGALPADVCPVFFLFEDGPFTQQLRALYRNVKVIPMSARVARATRQSLPINAIGDSLALSLCLALEIRRQKIDLVLTNSMKAHIVGSIAAKIAGVKCINYVHDILDGNALRIVRETSRFCAAARMVCSQGVSDNLQLPESFVVHSPIETNKFRSLPSSTEARQRLGLPNDGLPVIGLVGRIAPWKGQDRFIRLAARLRDRGVDAHFAIVGAAIFGCPSWYVTSLHGLVDRMGLRGRVHFVPWQQDLRDAYAAIDVACNCSDREPFGRTTIESLACGVPIVCFDDAGVCEVFQDGLGGRKVPSGNEPYFADAIVEMLSELERGPMVREHALQIAQRLDIAAVAHRFIDVVERVSGRSSGDRSTSKAEAPAPLRIVS